MNKQFIRISKFTRDELIGQNHRIINSGWHDAGIFKNLWKSISTGIVWKGILRNRAKDGSIYWVRSVLMPSFDLNKKITGYVAVRTPVSDLMIAEEEAIKMQIAGEKIDQKMKNRLEQLRTGKYIQNDWLLER